MAYMYVGTLTTAHDSPMEQEDKNPDRTNDDDLDFGLFGPAIDILVGIGFFFRKRHIEERIKEVALAAIRLMISFLSEWTSR